MKVRNFLLILVVIGMILTACTKKEAAPIEESTGTEMAQPDTTQTVDPMTQEAE
ncbi:MAG: hypothetical protein JXR56_07155 [Candidatus Cloacimonetes bacterium]|nr:hypothetical protein [Candidatus Cloacimonadota bacterium]